jgi:hypothetical protein
MTARRNAISAQYYDYNKPGPTAYGSPNRIAFPLHSYQQQRHSQHFAVRTTLLIQSDPAPVPQHSHQASVTARRYSFPSTSRKLPNDDIFRHYGNTHQQHKRSTKKKIRKRGQEGVCHSTTHYNHDLQLQSRAVVPANSGTMTARLL